MTRTRETEMSHVFDLEKRTTDFAKAVVTVCRELPRDPINDRLTGQLVGSAGSIGANYREANDALGKKDFVQRLKIARREAKECQHWLELVLQANSDRVSRIGPLAEEAGQLKSILSSIIAKSE